MKKYLVLVALMGLTIDAAEEHFSIFVKRLPDEILETEETVKIDDLKSSTTISQVKEKIHKQLGLLPYVQQLTFNGQPLQDEKTLAAYDIQANSHIDVRVRRLKSLNIIDPTTEKILITVVNNRLGQKTVADLKRMIVQNFNIPVTDIDYFMFGNAKINDDKMVLLEIHDGALVLSDGSNLSLYSKSAPQAPLPVKEKVSKAEQEVPVATPVAASVAKTPPVQTSQQMPEKSKLKKPMSKMTSREIVQLKPDDLSQVEQYEIIKMATLSGVEDYRSAARKVIDAYRATTNQTKLDWAEVTADFKKGIREKFEEFMANPGQPASARSPKKPIEKMLGREIGALNYEDLTAEQKEKLFEIALFSGLEDYRSAARKVIDAYRATKGEAKLNWDKELSAILAG